MAQHDPFYLRSCPQQRATERNSQDKEYAIKTPAPCRRRTIAMGLRGRKTVQAINTQSKHIARTTCEAQEVAHPPSSSKALQKQNISVQAHLGPCVLCKRANCNLNKKMPKRPSKSIRFCTFGVTRHASCVTCAMGRSFGSTGPPPSVSGGEAPLNKNKEKKGHSMRNRCI